MRRVLKPLGYSLTLVAILGLVSLRLYWRPAQVEHRLRRDLAPLAAGLEVDGCDSAPGSPVAIEWLAWRDPDRRPSEPVVELRGVELELGRLDPFLLPGWVNRALGEPPTGGDSRGSWALLQSEAATVRIEPLTGHTDDAVRWSLEPLVERLDGWRSSAVGGLFASAQHVEVALSGAASRPGRASRPPPVRVIRGRDLEVAAWTGSGALRWRGELQRGDWRAGAAEGELTPAGRLRRVKVSVQRWDGVERSLSLLPEVFSLLETALRPRGAADVQLEWERHQGETRVGGEVRHFDSTLVLPGCNVPIEQVAGLVELVEDSAFLGGKTAPSTSSLRGVLGRNEVRLRGRVTTEVAEGTIVMPRVDLRDVAVVLAPGPGGGVIHPLAELVAWPVRAGATGTAHVEWTARSERRGDGFATTRDSSGWSWAVEAALSDGDLEASPLLGGFEGRVRGEGDAASGSVSCHLDSLALPGLGTAIGTLLVGVSPGGFRVESAGAGIQVGEYDLAHARWVSEEPGRLAIDLEIPRDGPGTPRGTVSATNLDVQISEGLLEVRVEEAGIRFDASGGVWRAEVSARLGPSRLRPSSSGKPTPFLGDARELRFERGVLRLSLGPPGIEVPSLALHGPASAFRFAGGIDWDGSRLSGKAAIAVGAAAARLAALPDDATARDWAPPEGDPEADRCRLLEVSGSLARPVLRPGFWSRPAPSGDGPASRSGSLEMSPDGQYNPPPRPGR